MSKNITWKQLDEMSAHELYEVLKLRSEVFVVEQRCAYLDPDGEDVSAFHAQFLIDGVLVGYLRVLPPNVNSRFVRLGRVVFSQKARGQSLGLKLMQSAIDFIMTKFEGVSIKLSAQVALQKYYASLGFKVCSAPYDDEGIMHIDMELV